jgi:carbon monoxide dehydrogenase subunit G
MKSWLRSAARGKEDDVEFENAFEVDAPVDKVWETILDVEHVAPNVPGAEVLEKKGDNAYKVGIKVKLGPITMQYKGDMEIVERDDAKRRAVMRVKAKEARGQGTADATAVIELDGDDKHTTATIKTDVRLSGRAATMGRGVVQDVAGKLIDTFASNLAQSLTAPPPAPPEPEAPPPPPEAPAPPPPPKAAPPPPQREEVLDVGNLAGGVLVARLRDPRLILVAVAFVLGWLLGRRS